MLTSKIESTKNNPTHRDIVKSMERAFRGDLTAKIRHFYRLKHEEGYIPEIHHRDGTRYVVEVHGAFFDLKKGSRDKIEAGGATFVDSAGDEIYLHGHGSTIHESYAVKGFDLIKQLSQEEMKNILGTDKYMEAHLTKSGLKIVKLKEPFQWCVLGADNKTLIYSGHKLAMQNDIMYAISGGIITKEIELPKTA